MVRRSRDDGTGCDHKSSNKKGEEVRNAARVDANQKIIVEALRKAGAYVWIIGLPVDLLVGAGNQTMLMEIKRDSKAKKTVLQQDFFDCWKGGPLVRVDNVEAALRALTLLRS
jgi:hypothetical protein